MTRSEMVQWLKDEVTMSGTINITINDKEYSRIIDRELRTLYELYTVAAEHSYCVIPVYVFASPEFR